MAGAIIEPRRQLRFITPLELPSFAVNVGHAGGWHNTLPPPGTSLDWERHAGVDPPITQGLPDVVGLPTEGVPGDRWWQTLGQLTLPFGGLGIGLSGRLAGAAEAAVRAAFAVENIPVIYDQGGETMRWISSTIRGTLAGLEEFQFGINWGNPGDDPDPNAAETLAFAQSLSDALSAALATSFSGITPISMFGPSVKFTEVGAVVKEQTTATASDGTGGNLSQSFDTQWFPYAVGSQPTGGSSSITLPFEVSCAVSLQTDKRGPSGRGRLYLPPFGIGFMQEGGKFTAATVATAGKFIGAIFDAMIADTGHVPVIVSRRRLVLNEVTSINCGLIPDAQRRRRRSQDEARVVEWVQA
jgi:hypothetical protein